MESIAGFLRSDKGRDLFTILLIILVGLAGFALGRLSAQEEQKPTVRFESWETAQEASVTRVERSEKEGEEQAAPAPGSVVVSKNGKAYHAPWCPGAKQISDKNKVWYESPELAESAGYRPAGNCKGL